MGQDGIPLIEHMRDHGPAPREEFEFWNQTRLQLAY